MKEKIFEVNGRNYKVIEIEEGRIYELKEQRKNGVFYKVSRFNDTSLDDAIEYCKNFKVENENKLKKVYFEEFIMKDSKENSKEWLDALEIIGFEVIYWTL